MSVPKFCGNAFPLSTDPAPLPINVDWIVAGEVGLVPPISTTDPVPTSGLLPVPIGGPPTTLPNTLTWPSPAMGIGKGTVFPGGLGHPPPPFAQIFSAPG